METSATSGTGGSSVEVLLRAIADYAGTFPPAALDLADAVSNYARARVGPHAWMLGRFVLRDTQVQEFERLSSTLDVRSEDPSRPTRYGPWPVSLIHTASAIDEVRLFNQRWRGRSAIVAVEFPTLTREQVDQAANEIPPGIEAIFEVPLDAEFKSRVATVAAHGACVKIRTGGVTANAFPSAMSLVEAMRECADARVALKMSAGLHHALRGSYALTDDVGSPVAEMHGFLNVVVAAVLAYLGDPVTHMAQVLSETSADAFSFTPDWLRWHDRVIHIGDLAEARQRFFRSFGSCVFEEPVRDLTRLGIIT